MKNKKLLIGIILISFAFGGRNGIRFSYLGPLSSNYTDSALLITLILSLGPFFGIFFHPLIGKRSDRTWTKFGRRLPYLMVSLPSIAFLTALIPHASSYSSLITLVILEALFGICGFSPLFSLIPDNFLPEDRGKANATMLLCMGLGAVCTIAFGYRLWEIDYHLVFYASAAFIIVFSFISFFFVKEEPFPDDIIGKKSHSIKEYIKSIVAEKPIALYFAGDFFRWFSLSILIQMATLFANKELGIKIGLASQAVLIFNMIKLLSSLPIGMAADRIDRKRFLLAGIILTGTASAYGWFVASYIPLLVIMGLIGIGGTITIISGSALLMDLFPMGRSGEFLGLNMVFGCIPSVISLWISGALIDIIGTYRVIFVIALCGMIISFVFTKRIPSQSIKSSKLKNQI